MNKNFFYEVNSYYLVCFPSFNLEKMKNSNADDFDFSELADWYYHHGLYGLIYRCRDKYDTEPSEAQITLVEKIVKERYPDSFLSKIGKVVRWLIEAIT